MLYSGISLKMSLLQPDIFEKSFPAEGLDFGRIELDVSDFGASCQVMAGGTWATPRPFLRLRGVGGGREDAGKALKNTRDRSSSHRSCREGKDGIECGTALGIIQNAEPG